MQVRKQQLELDMEEPPSFPGRPPGLVYPWAVDPLLPARRARRGPAMSAAAWCIPAWAAAVAAAAPAHFYKKKKKELDMEQQSGSK